MKSTKMDISRPRQWRGVFFVIPLVFFLGWAAPAAATEHGLLSETYNYPDSVVIDKDAKLQAWNNISLADDYADKAEGRKSLKATIPTSGVWFGMGIIWDPNQDGNADAKNMSAYSSGSLKFWLKTQTSVKVGIQDTSGVQKWVVISVPNDNVWRFVAVPMSLFAGANFSSIGQLFMIANDYLPSGSNKTFHIDNLRWETLQTGPLDHIEITPAPYTIPVGKPKLFKGQGRDANNRTSDVIPTWTNTGISGTFAWNPWYVTLFTPSAAATGTLTATYNPGTGAKTGSATITAADVTWNDFFNIFVEQGLYGSMGIYDSDDGNADGDGTENNSLVITTMTQATQPKRYLSAAYSITANGWAGSFIQEGEANIVNPDMELGINKPTGWRTMNNTLTDITGWATDASHSASHSLKIVNTSAVDACWYGPPVSFDAPQPTRARFSGWAKASSVAAGATYFALDFYVTFTDSTGQYYIGPMNFTKGTHDWQFVQDTHDFGKQIRSIQPYCLLYGGTGTAWFDDVYVASDTPAPKNMTDFAQGYLYFWVKTPVDLKIGVRTNNIQAGTEQSFFYLSDYSIPADNVWREVYISLDDFKQLDSRIDYTQSLIFFNVAAEGKKIGASSGTFCLGDVKYIRQKSATPSLAVTLRKRSDNTVEPTGQFSWSTAALGAGWEISDQYLDIAYDFNHPSWGMQLWTDNMGTSANPLYSGSPTTLLQQQPAGLIGETSTLVTCPMAWLALDNTSANVPRPVESPNGYSENDPRYQIFFSSDLNGMWGTEKARNEWSWLKDRSSTKWLTDTDGDGLADPAEIVSDFSTAGDSYSTFINPAGIATGWNNPDGSRIYLLNPKPPIALYLAAKFRIATELQRYKTNTITIELYHY